MCYFKYFLILMLGCLGVSCQKFLTKDPDLRQQISTVDNIKDLLGTAYPDASYLAFTEFSTDNVKEKSGVSLTTDNAYLFPFTFQDFPSAGRLKSDVDLPPSYWNSAYSAIAVANKALQAISAAPQEEQKKLLPYKGEALLCRAYAHFMLACFFAETYNPATAEQTEGIPYVEEVENVAIKKYQRVNLAEVYRRIQRDLLEGLPLLSDGAYAIPKYHFTLKSAYAFAARFFLHKRDWDKVIQCADAIYPSDASFTADLRNWRGGAYADPPNIRLNYTKATEPANLLLASVYSEYARSYISQEIGLVDALDTDPYAFAIEFLFGSNVSVFFRFFGQVGFVNIPKYNEYFRRVSVNANTGDTYVMMPLFTAEEVLFNKAEAQILMGDTLKAIETLNVWAVTRFGRGRGSEATLLQANEKITGAKINLLYGGKSSLWSQIISNNLNNGELNAGIYNSLQVLPDVKGKKGGNNLKPYLIALLDLKRMEFLFDGIRWFDLMRYRLPVLHSFRGTVYPLGPNSKQRVFNVPSTVGVSGIKPTPR